MASSGSKKFLIIRMSSIGDIVLCTPLFRVLRGTYPDARIDFLVKERFAELVDNNPNITNIILFDDSKGFSELRKLKKKIQDTQYDYFVDIHGTLRSFYLRHFSKSSKIFHIKKNRIKREILVYTKRNRFHSIISMRDRIFNAVNQLNLKDDGGGPELYIPDELKQKMKLVLESHPVADARILIGLCPGAGFFTKRWPQEYFLELGKLLVGKINAGLILLGGKEDIEIGKSIEKRMNNKVFNACGKYSLLESAALMEHCNLVVTNDSGLMHFAEALKKKIVAIFGSSVEEFGYFPYYAESIILQKDVPCKPCSHNGRNRCPVNHFNCMRKIFPESVLQACLTILESAENRKMNFSNGNIKWVSSGVHYTTE